MRVSTTKVFEFHAAHHLPGHPTCGQVHGHTYKLEIEVSRYLRDDENMVIDFKDLKELVDKEIVSKFDHRDLNDLFPVPTAEIMTMHIWTRLYHLIVSSLVPLDLDRVRLWETPTAYAQVER